MWFQFIFRRKIIWNKSKNVKKKYKSSKRQNSQLSVPHGAENFDHMNCSNEEKVVSVQKQYGRNYKQDNNSMTADSAFLWITTEFN